LGKEKNMQRFLSFLVGTVMGALVGATLAILLAPSSGDELRSELRTRMTSFRDELTEAYDTRRIELEKQLSTMRQPKPVSPGEQEQA
jgi:gas vesicle protein